MRKKLRSPDGQKKAASESSEVRLRAPLDYFRIFQKVPGGIPTPFSLEDQKVCVFLQGGQIEKTLKKRSGV